MQRLGRGFAWLDTGTMESLVEAADFVHMIEKRQGIKISAPGEIAFKYGWIDRDTLLESAERYGKSPYGQHLKLSLIHILSPPRLPFRHTGASLLSDFYYTGFHG